MKAIQLEFSGAREIAMATAKQDMPFQLSLTPSLSLSSSLSLKPIPFPIKSKALEVLSGGKVFTQQGFALRMKHPVLLKVQSEPGPGVVVIPIVQERFLPLGWEQGWLVPTLPRLFGAKRPHPWRAEEPFPSALTPLFWGRLAKDQLLAPQKNI